MSLKGSFLDRFPMLIKKRDLNFIDLKARTHCQNPCSLAALLGLLYEKNQGSNPSSTLGITIDLSKMVMPNAYGSRFYGN